MAKKHKPQGHYCRVCGERKANERFSGKGHAAHICKSCAALTPAERSEQETLNRIEGMAFRHLNESEIKWLRNRMNDKRLKVSEAARAAHNVKFPRYERNIIKKGLTAFSLEFFLRGEVWDAWGDKSAVHTRFFAEDTGMFRRTDYKAPESERESVIDIGAKEARRFLKSVIHELDALFWDEDLSDAAPDSEDDNEESSAESRPSAAKKTYWSLLLELNNGEDKQITFYNQMHDGPQELFWSLMELFEPAGVPGE